MQTGEIILSVKMQLTQGNPDVIKETMNDLTVDEEISSRLNIQVQEAPLSVQQVILPES